MTGRSNLLTGTLLLVVLGVLVGCSEKSPVDSPATPDGKAQLDQEQKAAIEFEQNTR